MKQDFGLSRYPSGLTLGFLYCKGGSIIFGVSRHGNFKK